MFYIWFFIKISYIYLLIITIKNMKISIRWISLYIVSLILISWFSLSNWLSDFITYNQNADIKNKIKIIENSYQYVSNQWIFERTYMKQEDVVRFMIDNWFNSSSIETVIKSWLTIQTIPYEGDRSYYIPVLNQINLYWVVDINNIEWNNKDTLIHELIHVVLNNDKEKNSKILSNIGNSLIKEKDVVEFVVNGSELYNKTHTKQEFKDIYEKQRYSVIQKLSVLIPPSTYNNTPVNRVIDDIINWKTDLETNKWMIQELITFRFEDTTPEMRKKISLKSIEWKNICNTLFIDCE